MMLEVRSEYIPIFISYLAYILPILMPFIAIICSNNLTLIIVFEVISLLALVYFLSDIYPNTNMRQEYSYSVSDHSSNIAMCRVCFGIYATILNFAVYISMSIDRMDVALHALVYCAVTVIAISIWIIFIVLESSYE